MLGSLLKQGVEITNDAASADALIVNTCSFIDAAQEESVDAILESAQLREAQNRGQALIVSGCLPQRFRDELPGVLPEVDAFMGIDQVAQVSEVVQKALRHRAQRIRTPDASGNTGNSTARAAARVAELGQHNGGTPTHEQEHDLRRTDQFGKTKKILTPSTLGAFKKLTGQGRGRLVAEPGQLIAEGVKELNLISQDSTYYGLDLRPNRAGSIASPAKFNAMARALSADTPTLCGLLRELNALPGDFWVRLLYTHPAHWTEELIQTIAECQKV